MNEKPAIVACVMGGVIGVVIIVIFLELRGAGPPRPGGISNQAFFTDDDGATWFTDAATQIPPFPHNGRKAYLAAVFKCPNGKTFVGYLEAYPEAERKKLEQAIQRGDVRAARSAESVPGLLIKKPGEQRWVSRASSGEEFTRIMSPLCPDGGLPDRVPPGD